MTLKLNTNKAYNMNKVEKYTSFEAMKATESKVIEARTIEKKHSDFKEFILDLTKPSTINQKEPTKKYA